MPRGNISWSLVATLTVVAFFIGGCVRGSGPYASATDLARARGVDLVELNTLMRKGLRVSLPQGQSYETYQARVRAEMVSRYGVHDPWWDMQARQGYVVKGMTPNLVTVAWGWPDRPAYTVNGTSGVTEFWEYNAKATPVSLVDAYEGDGDGWAIGRFFDKGDYHTTIIFSGGQVSLIQCSGHD